MTAVIVIIQLTLKLLKILRCSKNREELYGFVAFKDVPKTAEEGNNFNLCGAMKLPMIGNSNSNPES